MLYRSLHISLMATSDRLQSWVAITTQCDDVVCSVLRDLLNGIMRYLLVTVRTYRTL